MDTSQITDFSLEKNTKTSDTQCYAIGETEITPSATCPDERFLLPPLQNLCSTWCGPQLESKTNIWVLHLSVQEIKELEAAYDLVMTSNYDITTITADNFPLPNLHSKLIDIRKQLVHGLGFFLLRGLPVEKYEERKAGTIFYGLGSHIGLAKCQNAFGHMLGHVRDLGMKSNDPNVRIYQTNERQSFHTDSSDVVGLLCLKKAKVGGTSLLVSASTIFNEILIKRPDLLKLLMEPIATDRRGETPVGMLPYLLIPVFSFYEGHLTVFYQRQYIESAQRFPDAPRLSSKHIEALDMFDRLANDPTFNLSMNLEPGDIQFVYNHALLHDRTSFEDWDDVALKRHLLRLWLSIPDDRPLPDIFATRYGTVEIGNRGGIIATDTIPRVEWTAQ